MSPFGQFKTNARATNATSPETHPMQGSRIHPEEQAFRDEVRACLQQPPRRFRTKSTTPLRLTRDDLQAKGQIPGQEGLAWPGWPQLAALAGQPCKSICSKKSARWPVRRVVPFGPVMVAPVIMAYGTPEQQQRFLPGIASGRGVVEPGYSEPGSGSTWPRSRRAERVGNKYIVNGQKTSDHAGPVRRVDLLPGAHQQRGQAADGHQLPADRHEVARVTVRPIRLDGECEVNEVFFDNVEVPAENLIGGGTRAGPHAKHLLSDGAPNIADVNRASASSNALKRITKAEGLWDDQRFRDQIALLEVGCGCAGMLVLRACCPPKAAARNSLDIAGLLKIKGSEIQQRYAGADDAGRRPLALPFIEEAMEAGWQGDFPAAAWPSHPLVSTYFNMRKTTIYGGSNEVQRNIVAQTVLG